MEFDSYDDIEDEVNKGFQGGSQKNMKTVSPQIRQQSAKSKSRQGHAVANTDTFGTMEDYAALTDSMDFENSDDINKIIQKYESMLGSSAHKGETPSKTSALSNEQITPK